MELFVKRFDELTIHQLYEILKVRVAVFVVEQDCPYMELDDLDKTALHLWLEDENGILAYLRVIDRFEGREYVSIGRVLSLQRRQGLATALLKEAIPLAESEFGADAIYLEAQTYAKELYEKLGFVQTSEEFLEDGIPHVKMLWTRNN